MSDLMTLAAIVAWLLAAVGVAGIALILSLYALEGYADREIDRAFREAGVERGRQP
jgi:4-hydroxybenzoate polyprenyltransferase